MKTKTILIAAILTLMSVGLFAQVTTGRRPGPGGPPVGSGDASRPNPLQGVQTALGLSDTQVEAVKALLNVQKESMQPAFDNIASTRRAYEEISSQANPDATALSNALTALREAEAALRAVREKFRLDFEALLTPTQVTTLNNVRDAATKIPPLAALGLVDGGPGGPGGPGFRGRPGGPAGLGGPGPRGGGPR